MVSNTSIHDRQASRLSVNDRDGSSEKRSIGELFLAARKWRKEEEGPGDQAYLLVAYFFQLGLIFLPHSINATTF